MKVLVTGGAGYIGAITADELKKQGFEVVIFDSLENGYKESVKEFKLIKGNIKDHKLVEKTLKEEKIEAVMHFAAYIQMGESMENPSKYFDNNTYGSTCLINAMLKMGVKKMVFSSTAGVYGNPERVPIKEDDRKLPENPYGESKLMVEKILEWADKVNGFKSIAIRYFNAAGASLDGKLGEAHQPESHLIPNVIKAVMEDKEFQLFGDDYPTADGTCIRDYVHVLDLASAHILALKALKDGAKTDVFNAGTGKGYSNKEVIEMVEKVNGKKVKLKVEKRRAGDANELVADSSKLQKELGWRPKHSDLETIIKTAWKWHSKNNVDII
ncbi:UDP-glucose 4-epimerase GalE [Patescibacteria group bacterium]